MFEDLLASAKQGITERLANPLLVSFVAAWSLWNYKFLIILFSAASVSQTFHLIETVSFPDSKSIILFGVLCPLASALAYVFAYPYPALFVYEFTMRQQVKTNKAKQQISDDTLLSLSESRALRAEYIEVATKNQEIVDRMSAENSRLRSLLDQSTKGLEVPLIKNAKLVQPKPLERSQIQLLQLLEKYGGKMLLKEILPLSGQPKVKTEFDLEEMTDNKLIRVNYNRSREDYEYDFLHEGRRVLLNLKE